MNDTSPKLNENLKLLIVVTFVLSACTILPFYESLNDNNILYIMKYVSFLFFIITLGIYKGILRANIVTLIIILLILLIGVISQYNLNTLTKIDTLLYLFVGVGLALSAEFLFKDLPQCVFKRILWAILIGVLVFVLLPSLQQSQLSSSYYFSTEGRYRFKGFFNNSNELARFSLLSLLISLRLFSTVYKRVEKILLFSTIILSMYIIYISNSRTSLIIAIAGLIFYIIFTIYLKSRSTIFFILISITLLIMIISIPLIYYIQAVGLDGVNSMLSGRLDTWTSIFNQSPVDLILGSGTEREGLASTVVLVNGYIELLQNLGLINLLLWLILISRYFLNKLNHSLRNTRRDKLQGISIVVLFLLYYLFEGGLVSIGNLASIYFWIEISQSNKHSME